MDQDGFKSLQKGTDKMNTLITWNQLREMEEAQNRMTRFLGGFPTRRGTGETHSLAVADWSPEVDISQDEHEYLLKADLPEIKKDDPEGNSRRRHPLRFRGTQERKGRSEKEIPSRRALLR